MVKEVCFVTVNFHTAKLTQTLLDSIFRFYPDHPVILTDGTEPQHHPGTYEQAQQLYKDYYIGCRDFEATMYGYNIHHGPGLHVAIGKAIARGCKYAVMMDSDSHISSADFLPYLLSVPNGNDFIAVGQVGYIDRYGQAVEPRPGAIKYVHPSRTLINLSHYNNYSPPIRHGAPMIHFYADVQANGKSNLCYDAVDIDKYSVHAWNGTVSMVGFNLQGT